MRTAKPVSQLAIGIALSVLGLLLALTESSATVRAPDLSKHGLVALSTMLGDFTTRVLLFDGCILLGFAGILAGVRGLLELRSNANRLRMRTLVPPPSGNG
jgi:ABC-type uncharacterized transport system permease subunit